MQLTSDLILQEMIQTMDLMQERMKIQAFELESLKSKHKQLNESHLALKAQLESTNSELEWIDKRTFVNILTEMGLMSAARRNSESDTADNVRYLNRIMRDWLIFRIHEDPKEPPLSKHVWKLSTKKLLFHKTRAVEQFRIFTKMRHMFDRTNQD